MFRAWNEFKKGKEKKLEVQQFGIDLEDNLFALHEQLTGGFYKHADYTSFFIQDPKLRHIHKAYIRDQLLHHAILRIIEPIFEKQFIHDSYSSRKGKGTHRAVKRLRRFAWKLSRNNTRTVWILKCDIKKFFDSVDHDTLKNLLRKEIYDARTLELIDEIITSYCSKTGKGIPLGNVTSQLFSNVYLNPLDQFIKRILRQKYYVRYADDFIVLGRDQQHLQELMPTINEFLKEKLALGLHPQKICVRKWNQGIDFLGYISFPHYTIVRTKTKRRIFQKLKTKKKELVKGFIDNQSFNQTVQSYLGILKHCRGEGIRRKILVALPHGRC